MPRNIFFRPRYTSRRPTTSGSKHRNNAIVVCPLKYETFQWVAGCHKARWSRICTSSHRLAPSRAPRGIERLVSWRQLCHSLNEPRRFNLCDKLLYQYRYPEYLYGKHFMNTDSLRLYHTTIKQSSMRLDDLKRPGLNERISSEDIDRWAIERRERHANAASLSAPDQAPSHDAVAGKQDLATRDDYAEGLTAGPLLEAKDERVEDKAAEDLHGPDSAAPSLSEIDALSETSGESFPVEDIVFTIPEDIFHKAIIAPEDSAARYWRHTLYRGPEGQMVKVHYCRSRKTTERVAESFLCEPLVGFDLEWKPNSLPFEGPRKNVSLIQVASRSRIALFHIGVFAKGQDEPTDLIPPSLKKLIESPSITKVGVAIKADCTRLRKAFGVEPRGLFELSHLHKLVKFVASGEIKRINKILVNLAEMAKDHLLLPLFKGDDVRGGDWSQVLNSEQTTYAASDPYACIHIYDVLQKKRLELEPIPPCPAHAELNLPILVTSRPNPSVSSDEEIVDYLSDEEEELESNPTDSSESAISTQQYSSAPSADMENLSRQFLAMATVQPISEDDVSTSSPKTSSLMPRRSPRNATKVVRPTPQPVLDAEQWVTEFRKTTARPPTASNANLRAYALWHHGNQNVEDCAALLRDPPLQNATVAGYIFETVRADQMEYDVERLRLVAEYIPSRLLETKFRVIKRRLNESLLRDEEPLG